MEDDLAVLSEGRLRVFRLGVCTQSLEASCFGWSATGRSVAVGLGQGVSVVAASGKRMLHLASAARGEPSAVLFSVPGHLFVASAGEGVVRVWEAETGRPPRLVAGLEGHQPGQAVTGMVFSRTFSLLASCSLAGDILLHSVSKGGTASKLVSASEEDMGFNKIAFRPREASCLASVAESGALRLWDVNRTGNEPIVSIAGERGHAGPATDLAFANTNTVATVGLDGCVRVHDLRAKPSSGAGFVLDTGSTLQCADFDSRGISLAVGKDDGVVQVYDLRAASQLKLSSTIAVSEGNAIQALRFAPSTRQGGGGGVGGTQRVLSIDAMPPAVLEKFVLSSEGESEMVEAEAPENPETPPQLRKLATATGEAVFSPSVSDVEQMPAKSPAFSSAFKGFEDSPKPWHSAASAVQHQNDFSSLLSSSSSTAATVSSTSPPGVTPLNKHHQQHHHHNQEAPVVDAESVVAPVTSSPVQIANSEELQSMMFEMKLQMHRQMRSMHVDMIRCFHEQQQETKRLQAQIEELAAENQRLRMKNGNN